MRTKRLELVHGARQGVHLVVERGLYARLRLDVGLRAGSVRIFQHSQLLREFCVSYSERDGVCSRRNQDGEPRHGRRFAPAFLPKWNVGRVERGGLQLDLRGALGAQVPPHAVEARFDFARRGIGIRVLLFLAGFFSLGSTRFGSAAFDLSDFFPARVCDGELGHFFFHQVGFEKEIDGRAVRWVFPRGRVILDGSRLRDFFEAMGVARGKQMCFGRADLWRELLERSDVVENPEAAAVGGHDEVVEPLLNGEPVDWRVRQTGLQRLPVFAVVKGNV